MESHDEETLTDEALCEVLTYLQRFEKPTTPHELYNTFCSTCHGLGGSGDGIANESLLRFLSRPSERFDINRSGHGGSNYGSARQYRPARDTGELTAPEIQLLIDYLASL
ncbi:MAG: mono/diheme cytochrome c family protein [Bradymonadia bacterium]|jgi:mono/diheme cytochrome c family protein